MDEHGGQVQALEAMQDARQQAEQQAAELTTQLEQEQQRLAQQRDRWVTHWQWCADGGAA